MARFKTFIRSFSSFEHLRDLYGLYIDWTAVLDLQLFYLAPSFPQIILRFRSGEHQTTFPYQALYYTFYIQANHTSQLNQPVVSLPHSQISKITAYPIL